MSLIGGAANYFNFEHLQALTNNFQPERPGSPGPAVFEPAPPIDQALGWRPEGWRARPEASSRCDPGSCPPRPDRGFRPHETNPGLRPARMPTGFDPSPDQEQARRKAEEILRQLD